MSFFPHAQSQEDEQAGEDEGKELMHDVDSQDLNTAWIGLVTLIKTVDFTSYMNITRILIHDHNVWFYT